MPKISKILSAVMHVIKNEIGIHDSKHTTGEKPVWLISERGFDARDNGWHLFKYMCSQHPEIRSVYVIDETSPDFEKVAAVGETVRQGSPAHYRLMHEAEALISTHAYGYTPDMVIFKHLDNSNLFEASGVQIFLQHGVLDKDAEWIYRKNFKPDMFVVSTQKEYDLVRGLYGHPKDVVALTGLCRYDNLFPEKEPKKQILFMPTWRAWLQDVDEMEFMSSGYFAHISRLLKSEELEKILVKYGYEMVFYPHIEMQKYIGAFGGREHIRIADASTDDVQALLQDSAVLITDYSSVYFDFLYLQKPVIFYQWDMSEFAGNHYKGVVADYERYGPVTTTRKDLLDELKKVIEGTSATQTEDIFRYRDHSHCERTYKEIAARVEANKGGRS